MALKGTTKIQLFDAKTGEMTKEVVETNMVTNAVPNILNPSLQMLMGANPSNYTNVTTSLPGFLKRCSPIGKVLFGGILVFNDALNEDANYIIPSLEDRNKIIGYAGSFAGFSGNYKKGSYNKVESVELENGFTHVWEFNTEQANGNIGCIALTSAMGGDCGWDTPYNIANRGNFLIPIINNDFTVEQKSFTDNWGRWADSSAIAFLDAKFTSDNNTPYYNEIITNGEYTALLGMGADADNQLYVRWAVSNMACDITLNQVVTTNAFENAPNVLNTNKWYGNGVVDRFETYYTRAYAFENTYRVWHQSYSSGDQIASSDANVTFTFIDFVLNQDGTITVQDPKSVVVSCANLLTVAKQSISFGGSYVPFYWTPRYSFISNNYLYLQGYSVNDRDTSGYFIRVGVDNPTDITFLKKPDDKKVLYTVGSAFDEWLLYHEAGSGNDTECYRTNDCVTYNKLDSGWQVDNLTQRNVVCIKEPYVCMGYSKITSANTDAKSARVMLLAPYLATINNLEEPVVKTSSQTMKITYTIQNT